jgi:hypothetical protein
MCIVHRSSAAILAFAFATSLLAKDVELVQNHLKGDFDCAGGMASVKGNFNAVRFSNCEVVEVLGNHNDVSESGSKTLKVLGNQNQVRTASDEHPSVQNLGNRNTITSEK